MSSQAMTKFGKKKGYPMAQARNRKKISKVRWIIGICILVPVLTIWLAFLTGHYKSFRVISRSMEPTLLVDDCLIMREQHSFPNLDNMIVVISDPHGGTFPLVKRVIAGASSTVRMSNSKIYLDGSNTPIPGEQFADKANQQWRLSEDEIFVLGDNRNNSDDSTEFGPIKRSTILGVITYRYWPFARLGSVQ